MAHDDAPLETKAGKAASAPPALALVGPQVGENRLARVVWEIMGERGVTGRGGDERLGRSPSIVCL
jgi:hypothetical protein